MIPRTPEDIIPALRATLKPGITLGAHAASVTFDLGDVRFRLDVAPKSVTLVTDVERPGPTATSISMPAQELLDFIDGRSIRSSRLLIRGEVPITAPDPEARLVASGILWRLVGLLGLGEQLRDTPVERQFVEMSSRDALSAITAAEARRLYEIVRLTRASRTMEIGLATGGSTVPIVLALEHNGAGHHWAIDPFQKKAFRERGIANVQRAQLGHRFTHIDAPDYLALPDLVARGEKFDFIFIDGCHLVDYTFVDFFYADLLLAPNGVVAFDDAHLEQVDRVVGFVLENRHASYRPMPEHSMDRMAVFRKVADDGRDEKGLVSVEKARF